LTYNISEPGTCPRVGDTAAVCGYECYGDFDCPDKQKCCETSSCQTLCRNPRNAK
jgi:hypothetical protein